MVLKVNMGSEISYDTSQRNFENFKTRPLISKGVYKADLDMQGGRLEYSELGFNLHVHYVFPQENFKTKFLKPVQFLYIAQVPYKYYCARNKWE